MTNISSTFYTISSVQSINVEEGSKTYLSDQGILYSADKSKLIRCPASTKLKTYTVLDGTQTISNYAFTSTSLSEITVSDTVTSIGNYAFSYCYSLKTLDLGRNVTSIGDCCLASQYSSSKTMNISNLTLPDNLKAIGNSIFSSDQDNLFSAYTNISNIYIPASVTNIPSTFYTISSVQSINVEKGNKTYFSDQGVLYLADKSKLIRCPASTTLKTYTVLDETKIISDYAFTNTSLTDITVSDSVTSIGSYAFAYCYSLKTLDLGRNVTSIGDRFIASGNTYTMSIDELTIPDNLEVSDFTIFYTDDNNWSILYQINVPASATNISPIFYRRASVKSINVEAKNKNYSSIDGILYNANQTELIKCPASNPALVYEIPNTVTYIWNSAFNQTNIQNILIPASVTKIGESVFTNSALKTIEGYTGSLAETYANENKYKFVSLGDAPNVPSTPDEPSDPGTDEPSDPGTDKPSEPNEEQEPFYDVNRDGKINIMDLAKLKTHLLLG